jgi:signal transduction histidine kinase
VKVTAQVQSGRTGLQIAIRNDEGAAGLPDAQRLFEKYYRSGGAHNQSGSGLGMYIVKQLMVLLGGTITYLPMPAAVTFTLWIPLSQNS